jgi:hypothetical protein
MRTVQHLGAVISCLALAMSAPADDTRTDSATDLSRLVRQLDADDFTQRREARQQLAAVGAEAIDALGRGAEQSDGHLANECISLLRQFAHGEDAALAPIAQEALQRVSAGSNPDAARLASQALAPPQPVPDSPVQRQLRLQMGFRIQAGQPRALPPNVDRQAEFEDEGRKVKLTQKPNGELVLKITQTVEGQEQVTEHTAANPAELLRKNREAFELYVRNRHRLGFAGGPVLPVMPAGLPGGMNGLRQMRMHSVNGRREIEVIEDGRRTEITDDNGRDIRARVTETVNGQEVTRTVEAADLQQLQAKDPALAAVLQNLGATFGRRQAPFGR